MSKITLKELAVAHGFNESSTKDFIKALDSHIEKMQDGDKIYIKGLGTFEAKKVPARKVRNPKTGETFQKPEHLRLKFGLSSSLKGKFGS